MRDERGSCASNAGTCAARPLPLVSAFRAVLACAHSSTGSERLTTDQKVAGSTPAGRTNNHRGFVRVAPPEGVGRPTRGHGRTGFALSLIHISEPTRLGMISYAVFCLKK